jgi:hypothetical protein
MCLAAHLALITAIASRDQLADIGQGYTYLPESVVRVSNKVESMVGLLLGEASSFNYWQQAVALYSNSAGIESGYGYFAPNVPDNYKVVFELHYPDGRVEYELPQVQNREGGLRLSSLLDVIGRTQIPLLREELLRMLAYSAWQRHPTAEMIRAVLGIMQMPGVDDFLRGAEESYEFLYAYDFRFRPRSPMP